MMSPKQLRAATWGKRDGLILLSEGAIRSGKTFSSIVGFVAHTLALRQPYKHLVLGRKLRILENEVKPTLTRLIEGFGGTYQYWRKDGILRAGNAEYHLLAGNDGRSSDRITGLTCHSALIDEATLIPEGFWEAGLSRLQFDDSKVWATCNPQGPRHWLKRKWIDRGRIAERLSFTMDDNPTLSEAVKERYRGMFSGVFHQRMILALWAAAQGLIYHGVREAQYTETKSRRIIKTVCGADYGAASPSAFTFLHQLADGSYHCPLSVHIPGGRGGKNKSDDQLCSILMRHAGQFAKMKSVHLDYAAASMRNALRKRKGRTFSLHKARKQIVEGIRVTGNLFDAGRLTIDPEGGTPIARRTGVLRLG